MSHFTTTLDSMLNDRGYEPMDTNDYAAGRIFMSRSGDGTIFVRVIQKPGKKMLGTDDISDTIRTLGDCGASRGIVAGYGISSQANDLIVTNNVSSEDTILEFFDLERLECNPTHTVLYNPHSLVTGAELEEVRRVYAMEGVSNLENLPKLLTDGPIVKYFGWKVGDVIRIVRTPKTFKGFTPRVSEQIVYRNVA